MWQYNHTIDPDELCHYGVKGMKWDPSKLKKKGKQLLNDVRSAGRAAKLYGRASVNLAKGIGQVAKSQKSMKRGKYYNAIAEGKNAQKYAMRAKAYNTAAGMQTTKGKKNTAQAIVDSRVKKVKKKASKRY